MLLVVIVRHENSVQARGCVMGGLSFLAADRLTVIVLCKKCHKLVTI